MHHLQKRSSDTDESPAPGGRSHDSVVCLTSAVAAIAAVTNNYSQVCLEFSLVFFYMFVSSCLSLQVDIKVWIINVTALQVPVGTKNINYFQIHKSYVCGSH